MFFVTEDLVTAGVLWSRYDEVSLWGAFNWDSFSFGTFTSHFRSSKNLRPFHLCCDSHAHEPHFCSHPALPLLCRSHY